MLNKMVGEDEVLTSRSKVDLSRLPPCRDALFTYILRSNHHLACYKRTASSMFERPKNFEDQGWEMSEQGYVESLRSKGPVLWATLVDILHYADINTDTNTDIDEMDVDWDCTSDDETDGYE